eukprot:scaffold39870_cov60-Phaeocystis_antarctica.AAC.1
MALPEVHHELVAGRQHAAADVAHLGLAGREVGTMELLALGRVPRQGGGGSALHADSEQQAVEAATIFVVFCRIRGGMRRRQSCSVAGCSVAG